MMIGQVTYGGRITDAMDNPTLDSILSTFITKEAMAKEYTFTSAQKARFDYNAPENLSTLEEFSKHTSTFPLFDDPTCFGLNSNANTSFLRKENGLFISTVLATQTSNSSGSSEESNDKENDGVNKFALTMLSKLEDEFKKKSRRNL